MSFYDIEGMAHLRGRVIDYTPDCGVSTLSISNHDDLTSGEKNYVGNINPDGTFEMDIPLHYPQINRLDLGETINNIFLIPGDTLTLVTSMKRRNTQFMGYRPAYYGFEGEIDDCVAINVLADSISRHFDTEGLWTRYAVAQGDSMKAKTYANNERLACILDSVVAELPAFLADVPVSAFAKDILSVLAIGDICEIMENLENNYRYLNVPRIVPDGEGGLTETPGDYLDQATVLAPRLKHIGLMYDNPLMICRGWVLPNRWKFNGTFNSTGKAAEGMIAVGPAYVSTDDISGLVKDDMTRLDSLGVSNCFAAQLVRTAILIDKINANSNSSSYALEKNGRLIANVLRYNDYEPMADALMSAYADIAEDVIIAENRLTGINNGNIIMIDGTAEGDILKKIIEPYRGNVLFLDFWGIYCGPCRAGMIGQKPMLAEYADKPFRALYIANADEDIESCKKWLRKEEIGGEHIFVSGDDWNRLRTLFNFSGIPFGVIIDENGNILETGLHMPMQRELLDNILKGK
ncbi:MAG: TlpA family protein disulfide reductase [Paramuribaculum sp.]|nr:TlpA family protein disulfide reductase [Paramuribaculum sp.]